MTDDPPPGKPHIIGTAGTIHRASYEMSALTELRNDVKDVRSRNISITVSTRHQDFQEYLVPDTKWERVKQTGDIRLAVGHSVEEYLAKRMETLTQCLKFLNEQMDELEGVMLEKYIFGEPGTSPQTLALMQSVITSANFHAIRPIVRPGRAIRLKGGDSGFAYG